MKMYAEVNELFGDVVKVTPSSKIVGDMALYILSNGLTPQEVMDRGRDLTFPDSVIEFFEGRIGQPAYGFPEELQKFVLKDRTPLEARPGADLADADLEAAASELANKLGREATQAEILAYVLYPRVFLDWVERKREHGEHLTVLPTVAFFHGMGLGQEIHLETEPGQGLVVRLVAIGDPDSEGQRQVFFDLNGQPRRILVHDRTLGIQIERHAKADADDPLQVGAPLPGLLASHAHGEGDAVPAGEILAVIEAMKMESSVTAPVAGRIKKIHIAAGEQIETGDLLYTLETAD